MKFLKYLQLILMFALSACTLEKTDYEKETSIELPKENIFKESMVISSNSYKMVVETVNGAFYKGYNALRIKITRKDYKNVLLPIDIKMIPLYFEGNNTAIEPPHSYELKYNTEENCYKGYVVFTNTSTSTGNWKLFFGLQEEGIASNFDEKITVIPQPNYNLNMTCFKGNDKQDYCIALTAPQLPVIGENTLMAGIFNLNKVKLTNSIVNTDFYSYSVSDHYTLELDPRMPEPSMGNHSSPNNKDLIQQPDGWYKGIVNYTMTGNWTLNFILTNNKKEVIKGNTVSKKFTPGVEGARSELYIDVLF